MTSHYDVAGLGAAFTLASAELGFASASRLFIDEVRAVSGEPGVRRLQAELGPSFPYLHTLCEEALDGRDPVRTPPDPKPVVELLSGADAVLIVGLEAAHLDALVPALAHVGTLGLLTYRVLDVDWERVVANYGGRLVPVDLGRFQTFAGPRAAVLTFVYGRRESSCFVPPAVHRVVGRDVRTQFRDFIAWDVIGRPPELYPRWLTEIDVGEFTSFVTGTRV